MGKHIVCKKIGTENWVGMKFYDFFITVQIQENSVEQMYSITINKQTFVSVKVILLLIFRDDCGYFIKNENYWGYLSPLQVKKIYSDVSIYGSHHINCDCYWNFETSCCY